MPQLPHQLCCFDGARRLTFPKPLYHSFRVPCRRCSGGVRGRGGFDEEMTESGERRDFFRGREGFIVADVTGFDERGADVEGVGFVEHRLDQTFHSVLGSTERPQAWNPKGATRAAENQIPPSASTLAIGVGSFAEIRKRKLDYVEGAPKVGLKLVPDLIVILIFASANHTIAGAIGYDVNPAPMFQALFEDGVDS